MHVDERVQKVLAEYPTTCNDPQELARLAEFYRRMKDARIARTREYELPLPDTIGRRFVTERTRANP
jgi:outer membrane protein assembly factor BamD (BamD/ComL family)